MQVEEHRDACTKGVPGSLPLRSINGIWDQQDQVDWDGMRVLDRATRPIQLKVKEELHIRRTSASTGLNRDGGYELPGC